MTRKWFQVCGNLNVPLEGTQLGVIRSIPFEEENVKVGERQYSLPENETQDPLPLNTKAEDQQGSGHNREEAVPPLPNYFFFAFTFPRGLALAATRRASLSMWV